VFRDAEAEFEADNPILRETGCNQVLVRLLLHLAKSTNRDYGCCAVGVGVAAGFLRASFQRCFSA